jgi:hypothetical protein
MRIKFSINVNGVRKRKPRRNNMPWFMYKDDLFIPVKIRALMIDEAVSNGLHIARNVLGGVDRYCIYEGNNELVIEFWRGGESIKLIHSDKPSEAIMRYYDAEETGLVKCVEY